MKIKKENKEFFEVTSVSRDDIKQVLLDSDNKLPHNIEKIIDNLTDSEMRWLASKLADDYCNQLFWSSLWIIFKDRILTDKKEKREQW